MFYSKEDVQDLRIEIRRFVESEIKPFAEIIDQKERFNEDVLKSIAKAGYLGASIASDYGGLSWSQFQTGVLYEEFGKVCSSSRSLLTVHLALVSEVLERWGTAVQKEYWLPLLAKGEKVAAFCLTEPEVGSDAKSIGSTYKKVGGKFVISGVKRWITFGKLASVFLFFARNEGGVSAFIVDRSTPGIEVVPIQGMLGTKGSEIAEIRLQECVIDKECLLGTEGWGFTQIANTSLDNGRFSVACGALGIARACLEESVNYAKKRSQFGVLLKDHQLIKQKIANMFTDVEAATLLCYQAANFRDNSSVDSYLKTSVAKYFSSKIANKAAFEAIQIHGAIGCHEGSPVQRFFRDARIMEIIEGSSELQQIIIADMGIRKF